jgi:hypothetical protein
VYYGDIFGYWPDLGIRHMNENAQKGLFGLLTVGFWVTGWCSMGGWVSVSLLGASGGVLSVGQTKLLERWGWW